VHSNLRCLARWFQLASTLPDLFLDTLDPITQTSHHAKALFRGLLILTSLQGCFFWAPFQELDPNSAPRIEYSSPDGGDILLIDTSQGGVAWVSVYDPDEDDVMEYLWSINGLGPQGNAQSFVSGNYQGSSIQLPNESSLNGRTLTCTVYDAAGASDRMQWVIDIEAAP